MKKKYDKQEQEPTGKLFFVKIGLQRMQNNLN